MFAVFTIRDKLDRIISARDMSKKERSVYEKRKNKKTPDFKSKDQELEFQVMIHRNILFDRISFTGSSILKIRRV